MQVAIHGNHDASIEDALDTIEAAAAKKPWLGARPLINHAQMTYKDQIDRMATLGETPSFFYCTCVFLRRSVRGHFRGRLAVTIDAAWQVFMDDDIGSIESGKLADFVILSSSPLTAPDLRELLIDMSLVVGIKHF